MCTQQGCEQDGGSGIFSLSRMSSALLIVLLGGGGVEVCITYLSPVAESKIVHWVICYRQLESHQPRRAHVPPTAPVQLTQGLLTQGSSHLYSSFGWVRSAVLTKSTLLLQHVLLAGQQITSFDSRIHWNRWEFFYCLPGALGQGYWVWDTSLECGSWPWMNAGQHRNMNYKEHRSFPF